MGFESIDTERLVIRALRGDDAERLAIYRSDPDVARFQGWSRFLREDADTLIAQMRDAMPGTPGEWYQFGIALRSTDQLIGDCGVRPRSNAPEVAEIGYTISREHQRNGFAREAVSAIIDYAFGSMVLRKLVAITDHENDRSVRLLVRLGFRREALMPESTWRDGRWHDEIVFSLMCADWAP